MFREISLLEKIIPKEIETLKRRYLLLKTVNLLEPVGRRNLSARLGVGEKIVRSDMEFFRQELYLESTPGGMILTEKGRQLLALLREFMTEFDGIRELEMKLQQIIGCNRVVIVQGNADDHADSLDHLGKSAAELLEEIMKDDAIVAITGGHTMKHLVDRISDKVIHPNALVVPARGSLGNNVETQANTLVETLAKKWRCSYKLLNLPDNLSEKAIESVYEDPNIRQIIEKIRKAEIIVFGIGNARQMAYRRDLHPKVIKSLNERHAVAEALGYYFNQEGEMVYDSKTIGFRLKSFENEVMPIAVAGGESKAAAIYAVRKFIKSGSLVIDKACAEKVLELVGPSNV